MKIRQMTAAVKPFALGLLLGACLSFPLGMNFAREAPLLSNPLSEVDFQEQVSETVKRSTETVLEGAREKIHEATQPIANAN